MTSPVVASRESRIASVEAWRFVAIVFVVAIHASLPEAIARPSLEPSYLINQVARFAVPFFFVVSGYFWGTRLARGTSIADATLPTMRRLLFLCVVWSAIYALPWDFTVIPAVGVTGLVREAWWTLRSELADPMRLLGQGTNSHLWFLIGLVFAMGISALMLRYAGLASLLVLGVGLYCFELLTKPYGGTALGFMVDFNTRNGPFVGTLFFATGYALSRIGAKAGWFAPGVVLFVLGAALHVAEDALVRTRFGADGTQDFVIGTYPMGVGAALVALSGRSFPGVAGLARLGRDTLGIYLIHPIFVAWIRPLQVRAPNLGGYLATIAVVTTVSVFVVRMLSARRVTRAVLG
jgi:surface polysaccharide O-acyltransferase-like enzyme